VLASRARIDEDFERTLAAVHKRRPQLGGVSSADVCIFDAKSFGFFEMYGVSVWSREKGVEPEKTFFGQGGRVNFVRMSFVDGPLAHQQQFRLNHVVKNSIYLVFLILPGLRC